MLWLHCRKGLSPNDGEPWKLHMIPTTGVNHRKQVLVSTGLNMNSKANNTWMVVEWKLAEKVWTTELKQEVQTIWVQHMSRVIRFNDNRTTNVGKSQVQTMDNLPKGTQKGKGWTGHRKQCEQVLNRYYVPTKKRKSLLAPVNDTGKTNNRQTTELKQLVRLSSLSIAQGENCACYHSAGCMKWWRRGDNGKRLSGDTCGLQAHDMKGKYGYHARKGKGLSDFNSSVVQPS